MVRANLEVRAVDLEVVCCCHIGCSLAGRRITELPNQGLRGAQRRPDSPLMARIQGSWKMHRCRQTTRKSGDKRVLPMKTIHSYLMNLLPTMVVGVVVEELAEEGEAVVGAIRAIGETGFSLR